MALAETLKAKDEVATGDGVMVVELVLLLATIDTSWGQCAGAGARSVPQPCPSQGVGWRSRSRS